MAGKVTVGLASHWPCVTDNSGITTYGLTALIKQKPKVVCLCTCNHIAPPNVFLIYAVAV